MRTLLLLLAALALPLFSTLADPLPVGAPAPKLTATDQDGKSFDLGAALAKGTTLVYFYPKAGTPGCTAEACSLRDNFSALRGKGISVIGVSSDTIVAQHGFKTSQSLPFTLLADPDRKVAMAFGVPLKLPVASLDERQSFLVRDGVVVWNDPKASTGDQAADELKAYDALPAR